MDLPGAVTASTNWDSPPRGRGGYLVRVATAALAGSGLYWLRWAQGPCRTLSIAAIWSGSSSGIRFFNASGIHGRQCAGQRRCIHRRQELAEHTLTKPLQHHGEPSMSREAWPPTSPAVMTDAWSIHLVDSPPVRLAHVPQRVSSRTMDCRSAVGAEWAEWAEWHATTSAHSACVLLGRVLTSAFKHQLAPAYSTVRSCAHNAASIGAVRQARAAHPGGGRSATDQTPNWSCVSTWASSICPPGRIQ